MRRLASILFILATLSTLAVLLAGCGSSSKTKNATGGTTTASGPPAQAHLSAAQYRLRLTRIKAAVQKSQNAIRRDITGANSTADLRRALKKFADEEISLGQQVGKLRAPKNAVRANALLAKGFGDTARQIDQVLPRIASSKNPKAALAILRRLQPAGGRELSNAVRELKKLGYTSGS